MNILIIGAGAVGIGLATSVKSQGADVSIYAKGETAKAKADFQKAEELKEKM